MNRLDATCGKLAGTGGKAFGLIAADIAVGLFLAVSVGCGSGPSFVDRPDFSAFNDAGPDNADRDDGPDPYDDSARPDTFPDSADPDAHADGQLTDLPEELTEDSWSDRGDEPAEDAQSDTTGQEDTFDDSGDAPFPFDLTTDPGNDSAYDVQPDNIFVDAPHDDGTVSDAGYSGIYEGLDDVTGTALVQALCPLVRTGAQTVTYSNAKAYLRDDVDNRDGQIHEIYTGVWIDPYDNVINVEHTWPQSKGAGSAPAQGDMHHLYLSNSWYNSARSNLPFGEVTNVTFPDQGEDIGDPNCTDRFPDSGSSGCFTYVGTDSSGSRVCEPRDAHKGNVARAVFYFQLRYGGSSCSLKPLTDLDNYGASHANTTEVILKEWNRRDPPDADEIIRNDRIESYEKVRNPFIDHPEFVDRIDFTP